MVIEGRSYSSPKSLKDLTQEDYNRVCVLIGDTLQDGKGACVGTLLGRTASVPVNRNIGRVKDGSLFPLEMFIGGRKVDESGSAVAEIYSKGISHHANMSAGADISSQTTAWHATLRTIMRTLPCGA